VRSSRAAFGLGVGSAVIDSPRLCRLLSGGPAAVTNGQAPDGHDRCGNLLGGCCPSTATLFV
jgi:hypothetical protein